MNDRAIALALSLRADPYPTPDYRVCRTPNSLWDYIQDSQPIQLGTQPILIADDTESLPGGAPYCTTFSVFPGTGRLIYTSDTRMIAEYRDLVTNNPFHHLFHNYLHDVIPFTELGFPIHTFTDTMVRAYHLCLGGGGDEEDSESKAGRGSLSLKVLAYRHLNMRMTSFKDTVYPYSVPKLATWLDTAVGYLTPGPKVKRCGCTHTRDEHEVRGKKGTTRGKCLFCDCLRWKEDKAVSKPTQQQGELQRLYLKASKLRDRLVTETTTDWADSDNDPWKKINNNWHDHDFTALNMFAGEMPVPSIENVPEDRLLYYACRDADATLRLFYYLYDLVPWVFYP